MTASYFQAKDAHLKGGPHLSVVPSPCTVGVTPDGASCVHGVVLCLSSLLCLILEWLHKQHLKSKQRLPRAPWTKLVENTVPSLSCPYSNVCFLSFFQLPGISSFLYLSASGVARSGRHGLLIRGNRAVTSLDPPFVGVWWVEDKQRPWGLPQFWEWWLSLTPRISCAGSRQVAVAGGHLSGADSFLPRVWLEPVCCFIPTPWRHCLSKTT